MTPFLQAFLLQASLDDAAAVQARLREAEHALEGTRGELRRREEAERTREERLAESERRQDDLRRRGEDDATREAKERAKRMRAEDDAKVGSGRQGLGLRAGVLGGTSQGGSLEPWLTGVRSKAGARMVQWLRQVLSPGEQSCGMGRGARQLHGCAAPLYLHRTAQGA